MAIDEDGGHGLGPEDDEGPQQGRGDAVGGHRQPP